MTKGENTTLIRKFIFVAHNLLIFWPNAGRRRDMGQVESLRNLIVGSCDFAVILLVLVAVGSIILFLKVFKSDFGRD
jgi:hypothetical protein